MRQKLSKPDIGGWALQFTVFAAGTLGFFTGGQWSAAR